MQYESFEIGDKYCKANYKKLLLGNDTLTSQCCADSVC